MDGADIAKQYRDKVNALLGLTEAMPPHLRDQPRFIDDWSVRDILAHLTYWDANNVWILESDALGHPYALDEGDVDARNLTAIESRRDMSWDDLLGEVTLRRDYRAMLHLRPTTIDYSGSGEHWDEHREEILTTLRTNQLPVGANTMTPGQIADQYAERSGRILDLMSSVPVDRRTDAGVCGSWSMKDLMGHLAFWDSVTIDSLTTELRGETWIPDPRDVDAIYAIEASLRANWNWDQVLDEVTHNRNKRLILHVMPVATDMSDVGGHWVEHGAQIDAWLAEHIGGE